MKRATRFCLRLATLLLLMVMSAWPSGVRGALSELNAHAAPMALSDSASAAAIDTLSDTTQVIQPAQNTSKTAASFHPCEDSLYLAWKSTPVKYLKESDLQEYARRDAACKQIGGSDHHPVSGQISRTRKTNPGTFSGFHTLAWVGAISTVLSGAILISIDDECDGITDFLQSEDECREEAQDARGVAGGFTLISVMVMLVGIMGGIE